MATTSPFSISCISQTKLLHKQNPHQPSHYTRSSLSPQFKHKSSSLLYNPLRYNGVSPIVMKPKSGNAGVSVKALYNKTVEVFNKEYISVSLAKYVADLSEKFIKQRGFFSIALSGNSVKHLKALVEPPYANTIQWSKWHVFWADEKVVPKTHIDSNYKLAYDTFISKVPIAMNVNTIDDALSAEVAADVYETNIKIKVDSNVIALSPNTRLPKFDLMLLDMGSEGQVAGLFRKNPVLTEARKWVTAVKNAPLPSERITLTLSVINSSANIAMIVTGASKADAVYAALKEDQSDDKMPVQLLSPEGEMKWFLDKGAASKLYK
ncbi:hypothetical protein HN51_052306 [Arachis hypogaea]|nr:probable 6-phosphogluconolactonase 5, chloroplastic [Arachis ipaensis]XP_025668255.1 6-phosphogluconolactonase 3, chloroplastic [Arachis hypogaea]QHN93636.1 putative 6-phosphogluconolactonase 5 [Arachis hypogaea]